jgi:hypothetical protein
MNRKEPDPDRKKEIEREIERLMEMDGIRRREWPILVVLAALALWLVVRP